MIIRIVKDGQAGHLLERLRLELHHGLRQAMKRLLPPSHQALPEQRVHRLAAIQAQEAGALT
ncbi:hypothetical protein D3C81_1340600 [compost metagenome]